MSEENKSPFEMCEMIDQENLTPDQIKGIEQWCERACQHVTILIERTKGLLAQGTPEAIVVSMLAAEVIENLKKNPNRIAVFSYMLGVLGVASAKDPTFDEPSDPEPPTEGTSFAA